MADTSIDTKAVNKLAEILDKNNLTEIEYECENVRICVTRDNVARAVAPALTASPAEKAPATEAPAETEEDLKQNPDVLKSPLVGVLYLSQDLKSQPFVKLGDNVSEGQTVCLIESMKTFNPVKAHKSGKIKKILVQSGSPVEYGEPLFIID